MGGWVVQQPFFPLILSPLSSFYPRTHPTYSMQYKDVREGKGNSPTTGDRVVIDWEGYTIGYVSSHPPTYPPIYIESSTSFEPPRPPLPSYLH